MKYRVPFPHIGTDIVHIPRIHKLIQGQHGDHGFRLVLKLLNRAERHHFRVRDGLKQLTLFRNASLSLTSHIPRGTGIKLSTEKELGYYRRAIYPFAQLLSGRWAAKEAVIKAYYHINPITRGNVHIHDPRTPSGVSWPPIAYVSPQNLFEKSEMMLRDEGWFDMSWVGEDRNTRPDQDAVQKDQKDVQADPERKTQEAQMVRLSISHDKDYSTAVCLAAERGYHLD